MSHTSRRGPPVECPLASLGRNTPTLDTQTYHHPLSSSPLDPQVYQMSRNSPILNTDVIIYSSSRNNQNNQNNQNNNQNQNNNNNQVNSNSNSDRDQKTTISSVSDSQIYHLSRSSSSSMDQSSSYAMRRDLEPRVYRPPPAPREYTPAMHIESLLSYHERLSPVSVDRNNPNNYLLDDIKDNTTERSSVVVVNHNDRYYLEEKMDSLYYQGAIRNLPTMRQQKQNSHMNTERYYLEKEDMDNICHYPSSNRMDDESPNLLRRPSSPSETSGSDRYLIDGMRSSPAIMAKGRRTQIQIHDNRFLQHNGVNDQRFGQTQSQHFIDGLSRLGRFSPSLDQGYHTLVSPSPCGQPVPAPWSKKGPCRSGPGFDRLSDDIIVRIFNWLDSCELCNITRVCRRFETIAWNPILWKSITIKGEIISGDKALKTIFRRLCGQSRNGACPGVERVLLSDGCKLTDKGLQLLARRCPELTHLQIQSSTNVSNLVLYDVVTKCTNLQHLDITGCSQITCINVSAGIEPPRRLLLQYLDLTDCAAITDAGLKIIVRNCPQLVYLYLRRCIQLTDAGLKFVPSFCIALRELSVSDCSNITDFGLYELAKLGATLRYLSVAKCDRVSDAGLKVIARRCYKLRYLNARGCEAVSDDSITMLARSCPRLRALDIGKCDVSDAGLRALAESCPNLKKLSLRNCDMITDRGVQCIAYYCRGLQQLNIQDCQISLEGYRAVKKYCKRCVIEHTNPGFC